MLRQQFGQVLFEDRHAALAELLHPGFVVVYADDLVAHLGKANGRHQPYVSGPDHTN